MRIDPALINELLNTSELNNVDFKREYKWHNASDAEKSEILKDILAFANALNDDEAYILIGIEELASPPQNVVGIQTHIDDANLQQFVYSKTNSHIDFLYREIMYDQHTIAIISIPPQTGPFFISKNYGVVKKNEVLMRVGTTTRRLSANDYTQEIQKKERQSAATDCPVTIRKGLELGFYTLNSLVAENTESAFDRCKELLREGNSQAAMKEIDSIIEDVRLKNSLDDSLYARALRIKANISIRRGEFSIAEQIFRDAQELEKEKEPIIEALLSLHESGAERALEVLGNPSSINGKRMRSLMLVSQGKAQQALDSLPTEDKEEPDSIRIRVLALLLLGKCEQALQKVSSANSSNPRWLDGVILEATSHYFCSLSRAFKPVHVHLPDPIPASMFRDNSTARSHLDQAEQLFRRAKLLLSLESEKMEIDLWLLAIYSLQKERKTDATRALDALLSRNPSNSIAVIWAVTRNLNFNRELVREACGRNLENSKGCAADVVVLLLLEKHYDISTLNFVEQHQSLFEAELQMDVFRHWHDRISLECGLSTRDNKDSQRPRQLGAIIDLASATGEWQLVLEFIEKSDDPLVLMGGADVLADHDQWELLAKLSARLVSEINTATSCGLAAAAQLNSGNEKACLLIIDEWEKEYDGGDRLPIDFWRIRSEASARLGDVKTARSSTKHVLRETNESIDLGKAAFMNLRFGDVRAAAPFITELIQDDQIDAGTALNWSQAVQSHDIDLAEKLLDHATLKGIPPELAGSAFQMASRLDRKDLSPAFFGKMVQVANSPGSDVTSLSNEEVKSWFKEEQLHRREINEQFLKGQIPLQLNCSATHTNMALKFELAFNSANLLEWSDPLPLFHASRTGSAHGLSSISDWNLYLDITALFVLEEIDLLEVVVDTVARVEIPHELPGAFLELENELVQKQPARIRTIKTILDAVNNGELRTDKSDPDLVSSSKCVHICNASSLSFPELPKTSIKSVLVQAAKTGLLDEEIIPTLLQDMGGSGSEDELSPLPEDLIMLLDSGLAEKAVDVLGISCLIRIGVCIVEHSFVKYIEEEYVRATIQDKALERVSRIRSIVSSGINEEKYILLPQIDAKRIVRDEIKSLLDGVLYSLLAQRRKSDDDVAVFDDRLINGHRGTAEIPIISTINIIEHLEKSSVITSLEKVEMFRKLRNANLFFVPFPPEEIVENLKRCAVQDNELVESPKLLALRKYVARCKILEVYLDCLPQNGKQSEIPMCIDLMRLADRTIELIWSDNASSDEEAAIYSNWVWNATFSPLSIRLPIKNRSPKSIRYLLVVQLSSLLSSSLISFMSDRRDRANERMGKRLAWVWDTCVQPYVHGDHKLLEVIAHHLMSQFDLLLTDIVEDKSEEVDNEKAKRVMIMYVGFFVNALPSKLKHIIFDSTEFSNRFEISYETVGHVGDVTFDLGLFQDRMVLAAVTKRVQISDTSAGECELLLKQGRVASAASIIEVRGAASFDFEEPLLRFVGKDRFPKFRQFAVTNGWFDHPPIEIDRMLAEWTQLSDVEFYHAICNLRAASTMYYYETLTHSFESKKALYWKDFDAPEIGSALRYLRLPIRSRKKFDYLLGQSIGELLSQYGLKPSFERLCGLPVDLSKQFLHPTIELLQEQPRKTKSWLLSKNGSILERLHKLALIGELTKSNKISIKSARKCLRSLLTDWQDQAEFFCQVLKTVSLNLSNRLDFSMLPTEQRLAVSWMHAHNVTSIIQKYHSVTPSSVGNFSAMNSRALASALLKDEGFEEDVATPELLFQPILLFYGMSYVFKSNEKVFTKIIFDLIIDKLQYPNDIETTLSPRILQGRIAGRNGLESIFGAINSEFLTRFNSTSGHPPFSPDWFSGRNFEILNKPGSIPPSPKLWAEILVYEPRWLIKNVRTMISSGIPNIKWKELMEDSKDSAICTLFVVVDIISYEPSEDTARKLLEQVMISCNQVEMLVSLSNFSAEDGKSVKFSTMYTEAIYRAARSHDLSRSCRILAGGFSTLLNQNQELAPSMIKLLSMIIPMLPIEHVEPLVVLRNNLMCNF